MASNVLKPGDFVVTTTATFVYFDPWASPETQFLFPKQLCFVVACRNRNGHDWYLINVSNTLFGWVQSLDKFAELQ